VWLAKWLWPQHSLFVAVYLSAFVEASFSSSLTGYNNHGTAVMVGRCIHHS